MNALQVGVAGAGNIATSRHLPAFYHDNRVELAALYDTNSERARRVGSEYDIIVTDSFADLRKRSNLVSLCTPPSVHCRQAVSAIESGCHVLTEKPMAMSTAEADRMISAANEHGCVLSVVHNFLFMDAIEKARSIIESGNVGNVVRTYMMKPESTQKRGKAYLSENEPSGENELFRLFWDEAAHLVYLTRDFAGPLSVEGANLDTQFGSKGVIRARFHGDAEGTLSMILDAPISEWWFAIFCERGLLLIDIYRDILLKYDVEPDHTATQVLKILVNTIAQLTAGGLQSGVGFLHDYLVTGHSIPDAGFARQISDLAKAIEQGIEPPVSAEDGRDVISIMETVARSADMAGTPDS